MNLKMKLMNKYIEYSMYAMFYTCRSMLYIVNWLDREVFDRIDPQKKKDWFDLR